MLVVPTTAPVTPSFDVEYNSSPDATIFNAVSQLEIPNCTLSRIQQLMLVDLNNDNNKDILVFVMCGNLDHPNQGIEVVHDDDAPNTMMALLSNGDGTYTVNNTDVFGKNHVQIGGDKGGIAGFFTMLEDTTSGIGLPHITYMVSRDDHQRKRSEDWSNHFSQQGVFTADYNNTYNLVELGEPLWAQGVAVNSGLNVKISNLKEEIKNADAVILPGVGAFIEAMNNLENMDLVNTIKESVENGKPFFAAFMTASDHGPYYIPEYFTPRNTETKDQIVEYARLGILSVIHHTKRGMHTLGHAPV